MSTFDPVTGPAYGFFDRARKAVTAAVVASIGSFGTALAALAQAGDLDAGKVVAAAVAAVGVGLGGLGITYAVKANKVSPGQGVPGSK